MKRRKKDSFLECFCGRRGDWIVYIHRGQLCVRCRPLEVKPPSTPGQVAQQEKMASIAIFYQALKEVGIYAYWQRATEGMRWSGYNLLVHRNLPAFDHQGLIADFSKLRLSAGEVALPDDLRVRKGEEAGAWVVEWSDTPRLANAAEDDRLQLYVMRDDRSAFTIVPLEGAEACRRDGRAEFRLPEELREYTHLYVIFCSHAGGYSSQSRYININ